MTLDDIADRLYGLDPAQFTAARDQAAREHPGHAGEIKALRRPTAGAAVVNALARAEPELLAQVLKLGPALARAQQDGDAVALRELGAQRRQLVDAVVRQAATSAGRSLTPAVRAEVSSTLEAGLVDAAAADAVRSGRLVRALAFAGFGGVDLADAVALPEPAPRRTPKQPPPPYTGPSAAELAAAESAALEAGGALDDAVRKRAAAVDAQRQAAERVVQSKRMLTDLEAQRVDAQQELAAAEHHQADERERRDRADAVLSTAEGAAEAAREVLDALRRQS